MSLRVVVVGGGLAGIACALDCAQAGASVTLVEVRPRLGGAACSFERDNLVVDNGQHVFLRCCTAYRSLLARLGSSASVRLQSRLEIPVLSPGRPPALLRRGRLPAPFHLAGSLLRYRRLTPAQRLSVARAALALARADPRARELDDTSFGDWLASHGQDRQAVAALWNLIALPSLNLSADQASAALCAFVFKTGLLERADAGDIGFHERPLADTIDTPARRTLAAAGVELRLGWRAQRIERRGGGGGGSSRGGGGGGSGGRGGSSSEGGGGRFRLHRDRAGDELDAEAVVVAVPHARAAVLLEPLLAPTAAALRRIASSPIVNVHVVYDRPVCQWRFAAGLHTPVQYLFDRTSAAGLPPDCQYLAISLSGAEREMGMSPEQLRALYVPALSQLLPRARAAKVERFMVTKEHAATFRAQPGIGALRPSASTPVPGLVLAGSWTDTGWPATLEGAVLSGHAAARTVLAGRPAVSRELVGR